MRSVIPNDECAVMVSLGDATVWKQFTIGFICKTQRLSFMGQVFTTDGLKMDDREVKALQDMPQPSDVPGVKRFLRLANYMALENVFHIYLA